MGEKTGISWCDATWNILAGCTEASPGCKHCWARRDTWRMAHNPALKRSGMYEGLVEKGPGGLRWTGAISMIDGRLDEPLRWRKSQRIFVASQGDLFHEKVSGRFINEAWMRMFNTPRHTWLVLTKRPERLLEWTRMAAHAKGWPFDEIWPQHIWLGVTAENQEQADRRIPVLLQTPAAVRWVSIEPQLGPVDLSRWLQYVPDLPRDMPGDVRWGLSAPVPILKWVVVGGESGGPPERALVDSSYPYKATPREWIPKTKAEQWVRSIRDQCQAAGVPFFLKGWGGPRATSGGHLLDGVAYREFPGKKGA